MTKKRNPKVIVNEVGKRGKSRAKNWFDSLSPEDRHFVECVVQELRVRPDVPAQTVARELVIELDLHVGSDCVARKLRELING